MILSTHHPNLVIMVCPENVKKKVANLYDKIHEELEPTREKSMTTLTSLLLRDIYIPDNPKVLDVGCGTGYSTFELAKTCNYTGVFNGIDISPISIEKAIQSAEKRNISNTHFQLGDAENLRFSDSTFDLVISNMSFQFIPDKDKALSEVHRVLKPRGVFAFLYPGKMQYYEARELLFKVAARLENPELRSRVRENDGLLIDIVESERLFDSIGFFDFFIYGFHRVRFVEPDWFLESKSGTWGLWKVGLSQSLVDNVHRDLLVESIKMTTSEGFKLTNYLIHATGKKPPK